MYLTKERLALHQLAALLKAMADYAYKHPQIGAVDELLEAVIADQDVTVIAEHWEQVRCAVRDVMPTRTVRTWLSGPSLSLEQPTVIDIEYDADALHKVVFRAWANVVAEAKQQPPALVLMETGGLLVPDPRDKDLDGLGIAEMLVLVAHDRHDGRPLLAESVLACGVAAALLAELMLRDLIDFDLASHEVRVTAASASTETGVVSAPVLQTLELVRKGRPGRLGWWLRALSARGHLAVCRHLERNATVVRHQRGRFQKSTRFLPTGETIDSIFRVATRPLAVGRLPTAPCAVVIELAKATRLTAARHGEWTHVHHMDPGATFAQVPSRERLELLLALTRAEVTELLCRP
jgi:hypothetical protein